MYDITLRCLHVTIFAMEKQYVLHNLECVFVAYCHLWPVWLDHIFPHHLTNSTVFGNTVCPTRYRTRHFFNNFTTNEDIATKFEVDLPHCVRNVTTS